MKIFLDTNAVIEPSMYDTPVSNPHAKAFYGLISRHPGSFVTSETVRSEAHHVMVNKAYPPGKAAGSFKDAACAAIYCTRKIEDLLDMITVLNLDYSKHMSRVNAMAESLVSESRNRFVSRRERTVARQLIPKKWGTGLTDAALGVYGDIGATKSKQLDVFTRKEEVGENKNDKIILAECAAFCSQHQSEKIVICSNDRAFFSSMAPKKNTISDDLTRKISDEFGIDCLTVVQVLERMSGGRL